MMETVVTVACSDSGVRLSRVTAHGEELVTEAPPEVRLMAVRLWAALTKGALEGYTDVDSRIREINHEVSHTTAAIHTRLDAIERRLSSVEQPDARQQRAIRDLPPQPAARHQRAQ